jgi:hypothetical protein
VCVERRVPWREEEGKVVLLVPRFGGGRFGRFLARLFRRTAPIRVRLDAMGSRAWLAFEPGRSLGDIAKVLEDEPAAGGAGGIAAGRLDRFVRRLHREGWIRLLQRRGRG